MWLLHVRIDPPLFAMKSISVILAASFATIAVGLILHRSMSDPSAQSVVTQGVNLPARQELRNPSGERNRNSSKGHREWQNVEAVDPAHALDVQRWKSTAMKRVEKLDEELKLNSTQQHCILEQILAFSAPEGVALRIGDRAVDAAEISLQAESLEDAISDALDPDRARLYQQSLMDHAAWWDHAIEQMESSAAEEEQPANDILRDDA
jgi:hypothetical protein